MNNRIRIYPEGYAGLDLGSGLETKVDIEDLPKLIPFKWRPMSTQTNASGPYIRTIGNVRGIAVFLHRYLLKAIGPEFRKIEIDHINNDSLDNRKANLRPTSRQENRANTKKTGLKGAYRHHNRWHANIVYQNKKIYLGSFATQRQAAAAYNKKAKELHGKFARLNRL